MITTFCFLSITGIVTDEHTSVDLLTLLVTVNFSECEICAATEQSVAADKPVQLNID